MCDKAEANSRTAVTKNDEASVKDRNACKNDDITNGRNDAAGTESGYEKTIG